MDIIINRQEIKVVKGDKVLKQQDLTKEEFKDYMHELSADALEQVRLCSKLFKVREWKFKDVK